MSLTLEPPATPHSAAGVEVTPEDAPHQPTLDRWTFEQYMRLGEAGLFPDSRTELIDGEIYDVPAQNNSHVAAISNISRLLMAAFDENYWISIQSTVRLRRGDAPDPDFAVRPGKPSPEPNVYPQPLLIIEVSDRTLLFDQVVKSSLYAANGIEDYWVVNVNDRQVEAYRQPVEDAARRFGWRYGLLSVYRAPQSISPLVKADAAFEVARMLA
jgi:Uma2 family endonuclease